MNLAEPQARKWMQDKNWTDVFDGSLKSSYDSFLDYLEEIRSLGPDHWKSVRVIGIPSVENNTRNHHRDDKPIVTNEHFPDSDIVPDIIFQSDVTATESEAIVEDPSDNNDSDTVEYSKQSCEYSKNDSSNLLKLRISNKKLPIAPLAKLMGRILCNDNTACVLTFGGFNANNHRSTGGHVFRYLPSSNSWDLIGMMPARRQYHSAVFFQQRIYVVGGIDPACPQMVKMHLA